VPHQYEEMSQNCDLLTKRSFIVRAYNLPKSFGFKIDLEMQQREYGCSQEFTAEMLRDLA
jgi:hypothetical protein